MKLRTGFVSNSSSSSFIVSAKKGQTPTVIVEIKLPSDEVIETVKQLDKYFMENYACSEKTIEELLAHPGRRYYKKEYDLCVKELKKGNVIHIGSVCNESDNPEETVLYDKGLSSYKLKNGKVIQDCQG